MVHPNWLHNSTTHYLKSDPCVYRPQGWDEKKHGPDNSAANDSNENLHDNENDQDEDDDVNVDAVDVEPDSFLSEDQPANSSNGSSLKSILIGKKRKRDGNDSDNAKKKAKTVKFKGIKDVDDEEETEQNLDPEQKILSSLSEFVSTFNQHKDVIVGENTTTKKDIVMKEIIEDDAEDDNEDDDLLQNGQPDKNEVDGLQTNGKHGNEAIAEEKEDDDNFDFEAIPQTEHRSDIQIKTVAPSDNVEEDGPNGSFYYPSSSPSNVDNVTDDYLDQYADFDSGKNKENGYDAMDVHRNQNEYAQQEEAEDEESDIMNELDSELESLSS